MGGSASVLIAIIVPLFFISANVLYRSGDAERKVDLRLDRRARLADLTSLRQPARIDQGTRSSKDGAPRVCESRNVLARTLIPGAATDR